MKKFALIATVVAVSLTACNSNGGRTYPGATPDTSLVGTIDTIKASDTLKPCCDTLKCDSTKVGKSAK